MLHPQIVQDLGAGAHIAGLMQLQNELEEFVTGKHMTMALTPRKHKHARIGLLDPPANGVCDIRCKHQSPGTRLLGRFARQDCFVGLVWRPRSVPIDGFDLVPLANTRSGNEWMFAVLEVEQRWEQILGKATYVTGENVSDYISENCSRIGG